jgi:hypothetical protein
MLSAKLFAGLAGLILIVTALTRLRFGPFYWQVFAGIMTSVSAFAYFVVFRFIVIERPHDQFAGLIGFFLIAASAFIWLSGAYVVGSHSLLSDAQIVALLAAILSFVAGTVITAANLAWALLKK